MKGFADFYGFRGANTHCLALWTTVGAERQLVRGRNIRHVSWAGHGRAGLGVGGATQLPAIMPNFKLKPLAVAEAHCH